MAIKLVMPQGGQDITTGTIVRWLKEEGESVKRGEVVCEVETEKAVFEVISPQDGILLKILAGDGEEVKILSTIGYVGKEGEGLQLDEKQDVKKTDREAVVPKISSGEKLEGGKIKISPKARKLARDNQIPIDELESVREDGKITAEDVMRAIGSRKIAEERAAIPENAEKRTPQPIRKATARRLSMSWRSTPHIFLTRSVDMTRAEIFRKEGQKKLSVTDLIIRACVLALGQYPEINASYVDEETIYIWNDIHIGLAINTPKGLLVPVIENADKLSLEDLSRERKRIVEKIISGKQDTTYPARFTISNLGMYGVDNFTAVINPPEAAILAVSSVQRKPVVDEDGRIVVRDLMNITLSLDHRVGDGVLAAEFSNEIKRLLEEPVLLKEE
ncbi:MAG TPA: 2-oxo acid dehydrogenase subunit E2 [Desulfobacteraceae bacterium]|nr:2-oxo acid dehydrogenase subunit E2 [Desulfobacteraceae bacterium]